MLKTIERFRLENEYMSCEVLYFLWIDIQHMMEYENKLSYLITILACAKLMRIKGVLDWSLLRDFLEDVPPEYMRLILISLLKIHLTQKFKTWFLSPLQLFYAPYQIVLLEIYIRHILVQCNRPKPSPTCTSSLGFSRLYILMLEFIVTQKVIVLHSYTIKM